MDNQRNFILAAVLSLGVVFAWQALVINPRMEAERAAIEAQQKVEEARTAEAESVPGATTAPQTGAEAGAGVPAGQATSGDGAVPGAAPAASAQSSAGRVPLASPRLEGSVNLQGGRIDDLRLLDYRETVDDTSPNIQLLTPAGNPDAYFAEFGYSPNEAAGQLPGPSTIWQLAAGERLTPETSISLQYVNDKGLTFTRTIAMDDDYMFTIEQRVKNESGTDVSLRPYGRIARYGKPETAGIYVLHEGLIGSVGEQGLDEVDYGDIEDDKRITKEPASSGWLGITDKYWATALIPQTKDGGTFTAHYNYYSAGTPFYQSDYLASALSIPNGQEQGVTTRFFAGAKKVDIIDAYAENLEIPLFDKIIDWGWFYWLTKPLFLLMNWVYHLIGNFGVAILVVTVLVKAVFFPLANKSYASMANMKKVQPQMTAIREQHKDDAKAQQAAMMKLYKEEKINPAAGCWPVLIQIPVFFAIYKVIYVTIEMRHAPFFGWIQDLSAPDPTSIFNLFGLLPFEVPLFLMIGVWPLLMGITMFVQMQMNPAPPDPTQAMIFKWLPVVFTFMLATFPAGLVIYWAWNNFLSIIQQGLIMKRQGAKIELWDNLKGIFSKKTDAES
ncbi:membrane protein insertase YidC [Ahrensia sp. R2A130]|uniref:membrane protein insertase YidC n=1 Tax=Ahrensia sp. R2A130 TaxID=744979 RepID=UPI0001E0E893|nr:membrane protein insertase YidC [Ahrensia sp. R2A130]EFL89875.1 inner membrane protein OxaA [Ahrensia sp. R2A130]